MNTILSYLAMFLAAIIVVTVAGFSKAYISYKLGDKQIKAMGKVSLNPKKHFEIIGFIMLVFFQYGWCAPIETSSMYYKNRKMGNILVSVLPLGICIFLAVILKNVYVLFPFSHSILWVFLSKLINMLIIYFVNFSILNIIPIYPLFGEKLFQAILPPSKSFKLSQYGKVLQMIVIFLLLFGLLQKVLNIISFFILKVIVGI